MAGEADYGDFKLLVVLPTFFARIAIKLPKIVRFKKIYGQFQIRRFCGFLIRILRVLKMAFDTYEFLLGNPCLIFRKSFLNLLLNPILNKSFFFYKNDDKS